MTAILTIRLFNVELVLSLSRCTGGLSLDLFGAAEEKGIIIKNRHAMRLEHSEPAQSLHCPDSISPVDQSLRRVSIARLKETTRILWSDPPFFSGPTEGYTIFRENLAINMALPREAQIIVTFISGSIIGPLQFLSLQCAVRVAACVLRAVARF